MPANLKHPRVAAIGIARARAHGFSGHLATLPLPLPSPHLGPARLLHFAPVAPARRAGGAGAGREGWGGGGGGVGGGSPRDARVIRGNWFWRTRGSGKTVPARGSRAGPTTHPRSRIKHKCHLSMADPHEPRASPSPSRVSRPPLLLILLPAPVASFVALPLPLTLSVRARACVFSVLCSLEAILLGSRKETRVPQQAGIGNSTRMRCESRRENREINRLAVRRFGCR